MVIFLINHVICNDRIEHNILKFDENVIGQKLMYLKQRKTEM